MSMLQLAQPIKCPAYRRTAEAVFEAVGRGGDNLALIAIALVMSLFTMLRAQLGK